METINHECYVSLEVAKLLKKAGFDWGSNAIYGSVGGEFNFYYGIPKLINKNSDEYSAPTLEVAQRWLREVKGWEAQVAYGFDENGHKTYVTECGNPKGDLENYIVYFSTYEQALEAGIKKVLELILEKGE